MGSLDPNLVSLTEGGYYTKKGDDIKKRRIDFWAEQTQQIFALNPDLLKFLPDSAKFLPYASVDPQHYKIYRDRRRAGSKVLRIVHAPTNREVKGTAYVLDAIAKLKLEGFQIELDLVEGKSHLEAIQQYSEADLVIDQVVLGWYGGLAVEAMAMGVPVLGFINNNDLRYVPEEMAQQIPILNADKNSIQNVLRNFILSSPQERQKIAKSSIEFVDKWHDPIKIAQSLIDPYFRAHNEAQNLSQRSR
jgi:glycosyltransferase involved in cell wall biosynthesis